jgi:hypothetical protein
MLLLSDAATIARELGADLSSIDADEGVFEVVDPDGNRLRLVAS